MLTALETHKKAEKQGREVAMSVITSMTTKERIHWDFLDMAWSRLEYFRLYTAMCNLETGIRANGLPVFDAYEKAIGTMFLMHIKANNIAV